MTPKKLKSYLDKSRVVVESALRRHLPKSAPRRLLQSMRYSLFAPGKRLRPILVLGACEALGGRVRDALPAACAIEMIHTYSLIHDDLPAMDDDDERRGKPSNHKAFDEATAILAGDALQAAAFEIIARHTPKGANAAELVRELAVGAGAAGMVGGQVLDLAEGTKLHSVHAKKTAALFHAATRMGAIAAHASKSDVKRLGVYGFHLGLAFQAIDDILDGEGEMDAARRRARRHTDAARHAIVFLGKRGEHLGAVAEAGFSRKK